MCLNTCSHIKRDSFSGLSFKPRCGKCRRYMKFVQAKPSRLYCSICDDTYNLPQNGNIKLYKEIKCPLDDFELVLWTTGAKGKVTTVPLRMCARYEPQVGMAGTYAGAWMSF